LKPCENLAALAAEVLARCEVIAAFSEVPGAVTRTFLCEPMHRLHDQVGEWMRAASMQVRRDAIGNLIGHYPGSSDDTSIFLIGSHLDTVPNAGKFDGVLGVLLGLAAVQALDGRRLPFSVEVIAFSEEEGVRFGTPYLGSRATAGRFEPALLELTDGAGVTLAQAIRSFGLDPGGTATAAYRRGQVLGYLEAHIEQGPILESLGIAVGVVEAIVGQGRLWLRFDGKAGHAGTLPMELRQDALAAAAEFVVAVEQLARSTDGLRATVGSLSVLPGAVNVVPGSVRLSLDIRHASDAVRDQMTAALLRQAEAVAARRGVRLQVEQAEHDAAVSADPRLANFLADCVRAVGCPVHRLVSGAGHDAAVMASLAPMAMLFLRSPGGISHHPDEGVLPEDVEVALRVMVQFLLRLAGGQA
jgi:allantoate deiminase